MNIENILNKYCNESLGEPRRTDLEYIKSVRIPKINNLSINAKRHHLSNKDEIKILGDVLVQELKNNNINLKKIHNIEHEANDLKLYSNVLRLYINTFKNNEKPLKDLYKYIKSLI